MTIGARSLHACKAFFIACSHSGVGVLPPIPLSTIPVSQAQLTFMQRKGVSSVRESYNHPARLSIMTLGKRTTSTCDCSSICCAML